MNQPQRESWRKAIEWMLFVIASVIGIYGLGRGLTGMFEPGQGISLPWLAVMCVAFIVLFAQMGRVHDTWPRKPEEQSQPQTTEQLAQLPPVQAEER
ncbi:MAG TPA: hypothetical protein VGT82_16700 [Ktedonobacteraceae bacterium]|nr:hypothetical protein [Ktedonobacteraceae bacterium]